VRLPDDELRAALRAEAAGHQPDREAILDRITMAATSAPVTRRRAPGQGPRVRMTAAAAAVAALLAGGGVANWALAGSNDAAPPLKTPVVAPSSPASTSSSAASGPAQPTSPAAPRSQSPSPASPSLASPSPASPSPASPKSPSANPSATAPGKGQPGNTRVEQGPLWSDGSVINGSSVVTVKTTEVLTALDVVIRVARTEGLVSRGGTKQTPGGSVTTSVTEEPNTLLYRFVLSTADTLEPGTYTFTAKYTYPAENRDAGGDTYEAVAATASAPDLNVYGNFYPAS
jgi:hypothetical protein